MHEKPEAAHSAKNSPRPLPRETSSPTITPRPTALTIMQSQVIPVTFSPKIIFPSKAVMNGAAARMNIAFGTEVYSRASMYVVKAAPRQTPPVSDSPIEFENILKKFLR